MAKLLFGCGYLGHRVARRWLARGETVVVVTRSESRAQRLRDEGMEPIVADITDRSSSLALSDHDIDAVVFAVGFDRSANQSIEEVYVGGLDFVLSRLPTGLRRFVYVSSTGVYGQTSGEWVDEDSECGPLTAGGAACLAAEQLLQSSSFAEQSTILRLAGIYGPERVPRQATLLAGEPIASPRTGYLNLIHVEDAAAAVLAAADAAAVAGLILVSDGEPVVREDYFAEMARLVEAPPVRFSDPSPQPPRSSRAASNKRVSNAKMLKELAVRLQFPSYREGLQSILRDA